jgi:agmatinase
MPNVALIAALFASSLLVLQLSIPVAASAETPTDARAVPSASEKSSQGLEPVTIPDDLLGKIPEQNRDYIKSGRATRFVKPDDLFDHIRKSTAEQITAYIAALQSVDDNVDFKAGRDKVSIALDRSSPDFNTWKTRRPDVLNPHREAGPITLTRYVGGYGGGFPTFANAPAALTPEDLIAGKVEVAIVGAPLDMGSGFRDALHGPLALRTAMGAQSPTGNDMYSMINPLKELRIVDYGDIAIDNLSTDRSVDHVREMVREIAKTGAIPVIIGGDHSLEYPNLAAMADVYGKGKVGVVHFDSHYDAGHDRVHLIDHGQPVYRVIHEGHVLGKNYIQVGLRARSPDIENFNWMREQGMHYHTMVEVEKRGWEAVMERALAEAKKGTDKLYISFDIDVLDPAFMPGTGTPVPGGLTMREVQPIMRRLCAENNIVGFDIVEVAPYLDSSYKTALNSDYILNACLTGIAMHKKGLVQAHYLSPLSSDHGQDGEQK